MSRSRRHHSYIGVTVSKSEKFEKQKAHRRFRQKCKQLIDKDEDSLLPDEKEIDDIWNRSKDGKMWFNKNKYPKLMRK